MGNPTGKFIWYELLTKDADAAQAFYSEVIGWRVTASDLPGMDYRLLHAGDADVGGLMQLGQDMLDAGTRPGWMAYVAVDDVDTMVNRFKGSGGNILVPPGDIPDVGRFALVSDPQGIPIYLLRDPSEAPSRANEGNQIGHCAWNELSTPDPEAALAFYAEHLGWSPGDRMAMGDMGHYLMFNLDDAAIGGIMSSTATDTSAGWRFYFRVASLEAAMESIQQAGGQVVHGPQDVPGEDRIIIGTDPQGVQFCLVAGRQSGD